MHPLKTIMHFAQAAHAQFHGGPISQEDKEQLQYANMLIDVSHTTVTQICHVFQEIDVQILGQFGLIKYELNVIISTD